MKYVIMFLLFFSINIKYLSSQDTDNQEGTKDLSKTLSLLINGSIKSNASSGTNLVGTGSLGLRYYSQNIEMTALINVNESSKNILEDTSNYFGDAILLSTVGIGSLDMDFKYYFLDFPKKWKKPYGGTSFLGINPRFQASYGTWEINKEKKLSTDTTMKVNSQKIKALVLAPSLDLLLRVFSNSTSSVKNNVDNLKKETKRLNDSLKLVLSQTVIENAKKISELDSQIKNNTIDDDTLEKEKSELEIRNNALSDGIKKLEVLDSNKQINALFDKLNVIENRVSVTLNIGLAGRFLLGNIRQDDTFRKIALNDSTGSKTFLGFQFGIAVEINNFKAFFNVPYLWSTNSKDVKVLGLTGGSPIIGIEFRGDIWKFVSF